MAYDSEKLNKRAHRLLGLVYNRGEGVPFTIRSFWSKSRAPKDKELISGTRPDPNNPLPTIYVHQRNKGEVLVTMRLGVFMWIVENFFGESQIADYFEKQEVVNED